MCRIRLHIGFDDPSDVADTDEIVIYKFRCVRNEVKTKIYSTSYYSNFIKEHYKCAESNRDLAHYIIKD